MNLFMTNEEVSVSNIKMFNVNEKELTESCQNSQSTNVLYDELADDLEFHIDSLNMNITKTKQYTNIMRIGWFLFKIYELQWNNPDYL